MTVGKSNLKYCCIMCYSCFRIIFSSICISQNRTEVLFFSEKISILLRRKRKPATCVIAWETCSFIFTKTCYKQKKTVAFAEIVQEREPGATQDILWFLKCKLQRRRNIFLDMKPLSFFHSASSEHSTAVFVFYLG